MRRFVPPTDAAEANSRLRAVFLAGSIEMGVAEDWQSRVEKMLEDEEIDVYNPRRPDWDWTWEQRIDNPQFYEQVKWEHNHLLRASHIIFYFQKDTKSPVSMLELGLMAGIKPNALVVVCPEEFWRKGNVDIICDIYGIRQVETLEDAVELVKNS